jgi:Holliday junction resolvase RusA-like endonuclease
MFTPEKTVSYEGLVGWTAAQAMAGRDLMLGPVAAVLHMRLDVPASWSKKKQAEAFAGRLRPTSKPDMDNVVKAVFDALNGVVWRDDVQVVSLHCVKSYAPAPGVYVRIEEMA